MANGRGTPPGDDGHVIRFPRGQRTQPAGIEPFAAFSPAKWYGKPVPAYDWMVDGCLLRGTVGMVSGDGGIGKSLLMQQLLTAISVGKDWLGLATKKCRVFGLFCEDDEPELHRRQDRINALYDCDYPDIEGLYVDRAAQDNVLMEFDRRTDRPLPTPLWDQMERSVSECGAQLILLDTVADTFGGSEIVRVQVRRFITELRRLAMRIQGAVIITAHPSLTGMNTGTGLSGSTAWHNSVRSRMYLTKPKNSETEDEDAEDVRRVLRTMKNNQGSGAGRIDLIWQDGVFIVAGSSEPRATMGTMARLDLDSSVLEAVEYLISSGDRIAAGRQSNNNIYKSLSRLPNFRHAKSSDIFNSADRLLRRGSLKRVHVGRPGKISIVLRTISVGYHDEIAEA